VIGPLLAVVTCLSADGATIVVAAPSPVPEKAGDFVELSLSMSERELGTQRQGGATARLTVADPRKRIVQVSGLGPAFELQLPATLGVFFGQASDKTVDGRSVSAVCTASDLSQVDGPVADECHSADHRMGPSAGLISFRTGGASPSGDWFTFGAELTGAGERPAPGSAGGGSTRAVLTDDRELIDVLLDHLKPLAVAIPDLHTLMKLQDALGKADDCDLPTATTVGVSMHKDGAFTLTFDPHVSAATEACVASKVKALELRAEFQIKLPARRQ
jgi:hypothetical protein